MTVLNILEYAHNHGAWWWNPLMRVAGYKNPLICNRFYYAEPFCLDGWYDHLTFGAPLRVYFGKERDQWVTIRDGDDDMWHPEPISFIVSDHARCPNCGEVEFEIVDSGYHCPTCDLRWT